MSRLGPFGRLVAASAILAWAPLSSAAAVSASCSQDGVETDPASVIAPCTSLLANPGLSDEERSKALFIRGQGYHRTRKLDDARRDYDAALKLTPNDDAIYPERSSAAMFGDLYLQRAILLVEIGRTDDAMRDLDSIGAIGGPRAVLRLQVYLRGHGFSDVPIDGKRSQILDDAIKACFVNKACGRGLTQRS